MAINDDIKNDTKERMEKAIEVLKKNEALEFRTELNWYSMYWSEVY